MPFWVGGPGNLTDAANHWAAVSGGAPGAGNLPTSATDAIFDANSGSPGAYTVTVDGAFSCANWNMSAAPSGGGTITLAGAAALSVFGNFTLLAGMTRTFTGSITFAATALGKTITSNAVTYSSSTALIFNGVGGGWTFQDDCLGVGNHTFTNGALNYNGKTFTYADCLHTSAGTFTLTTGAASITLSGLGTAISWTQTGMTVVGGTETWHLRGGCTANGGPSGVTVGNVVFDNGSGSSTLQNMTIGALTFSTSAASTLNLGTNITVNGTFTSVSPSAVARHLIQSSVVGTARTLTAAAVSLTDVDFGDITGAGAATWSGTRLGDVGGNTNLTLAAPASKFYVGNTGSTTGTVWALVTGGAAALNNYPLPQDTAVFDANSFSANGQTVTLTASTRLPSMTFAAINRTGIIMAINAVDFYGTSLVLEANMVTSGTSAFTVRNRGTTTFNTAGVAWTSAFTINPSLPAAIFRLTGNLTVDPARISGLTNGVLDLNSKVLSSGTFNANSATNGRTIKDGVGGGKIVATGTSGTTMTLVSANLTIDRTNPWTLEVGGNTATSRTFAGGGTTLPKLTFTNTTVNGTLALTGNNTFSALDYTGGTAQSITFANGSTTTIETANGFPTGTVGNVITIGTTGGAGSHNLVLLNGGTSSVVSRDYLSVSRSAATPAGAWGAGHNSVDGGNTSGWNFGDSFIDTRAESATGTDASDRGLGYLDSAADAGTGTDAASSALTLAASVAEAAVATDQATGGFVFSDAVAESATGVDSSSQTVGFFPVRVTIEYLPSD